MFNCQTLRLQRAGGIERWADRFFNRQIPIDIVETALLLGSARRLFRRPAPAPIRSLAYFESIVEELLAQPFPADSVRFWRFHIGIAGANPDLEHDWEPPEPPF